MKKLAPLLLLTAAAAAAPAVAKPKILKAASQLDPSLGGARFSVQAQVQQIGTLYVWFLRVGGDPASTKDVLRFQRSSGVPVAGTNMIDSRPAIYAMQPGRYRLLAHAVQCAQLPPVGTVSCSDRFSKMPARRYGDGAPEFEVKAGQVTDVGDFVLEAPSGASIEEGSAVKFAQRMPELFQIRVMAVERNLPPEFSPVDAASAPTIPPAFKSQIRCMRRPKGAMMFLPFDC